MTNSTTNNATTSNHDAWWAWHDQDSSRWSASDEEAEARCAAWVAGESDDGPEYTITTKLNQSSRISDRIYRVTLGSHTMQGSAMAMDAQLFHAGVAPCSIAQIGTVSALWDTADFIEISHAQLAELALKADREQRYGARYAD